MSPKSKLTPPLYLWVIIGALVILCFITIKLFIDKELQTSFLKLTKKRLEKFANEINQSSSLSVIALGSSKLAFATYPDSEMQSFYSSQTRSRIHYLRIWHPGATITHLESLFSILISVKPDIILLEPQILYYAETKNNASSFIIFLRSTISQFNSFLKYKAKNFINQSGEESFLWDALLENRNDTKQSEKHLAHYLQAIRAYSIDQLDPGSAQQFIEYAAQNKVKIILLDIPISKIAKEKSPDVQLNRTKAIDYLKRKYNLESWQFKDNELLNWYIDFSHFNDLGRNEFCKWLVKKIQNIDSKS